LTESAGHKKSTGAQRAAQLLVALGPTVASDVLRALDEDEVAMLTSEVSRVGVVSAAASRSVLEEFFELAESRRHTATGGDAYALQTLTHGFGEDRAGSILDRVRQGDVQMPYFGDIQELDPLSVRDLLLGEHPQVIAVVLAHFSAARAAHVIAALDSELRSDVLLRLAGLGQLQNDALAEIQLSLRSRLSRRPEMGPGVDGKRLVAGILNSADKDVAELILEQIRAADEELAGEIERRLFLFEDLVRLDGRSIQKVLREVDAKLLSVALKGATAEVQSLVFANMSKRAAAVLESELEVMGPVPVSEVEISQAEIIQVVRKLESAGEIVVPRGGEGGE
jgi:flagellar motor switch protein FliG